MNAINSTQNTISAYTQDQSISIQSAFKSTGSAIKSSGVYSSKPVNPLDTLISTGTITQDQVASIKSAFESSIRPAKPQNDPVTSTLDALVTSGTITLEQETTIENAFETAM
ncbi:MAG: Ni,Fe-hydrogenase III small subunit [Clostridium sp.]|jgi:Ni,Fe-hydrogenase III small subunit